MISQNKIEELTAKPGMIFDLDGTLLDSMGVWNQIDIDFFRKRGMEVPEDYQETITPMGSRQAAIYTVEQYHMKESPEDLMREWFEMAYEAYSTTLPLKPGAYRFVKEQFERGTHMAVATSSDRELVDAALERTGLMPMMDSVVTVHEVKRGKGFPDIYEKCASDIGLAPRDCAVFEDIIHGIRGANAGGFYSVGVYEKRNEPSMEQIQQESRLYIHSFRELLQE